ncbi:MAG: TIGR04282 family arsenosugar biosynthesis glycosyltransferase [Deltaproteobacteria bacterium]|nr:TIGR04282 family arsenosugar biosynthesis glycosyltransferase [Deltaproteobacteria bacterium]
MDTLCLFAKWPTPGQVKTRLAAHIGPERAARLYRRMVEHVVRQTDPAASRRGYRRVLYGDPPEAAAAFRAWLPAIAEQRSQRGADLGERMARAFAECAAEAEPQPPRTCVIGTDCLALDARDIDAALGALDFHDMVIGPTRDGGYYLLGLTVPRPALFTAIAWGTDAVCKATMHAAAQLRLRVAVLPERRDIDTVQDLPCAHV